MAFSKITLNGTTLMDVTGDSVTPSTLLKNETATAADGESITGVVELANAGTATPEMDGAAAVGISTKYAREDHVHPSDTSKLSTSLKGANNGLAELDSSGKVPTSQLPSYVDDVLEYTNKSSFPATGETGKIYVDKATNLTYRWSGTAYVEISPSLALGTTSSTAYRGDYGDAAYQHGVTNKGSAFSSGLYKITTNSEGHVTAASAVQKSDITALGIPAQDTTYSEATTSASGLMSSDDKTKLNGIATGAEVNQNAFSNVKVGSTTVAAESKTDTLELVAGSNITLTPDATNDKVTIAATDTTYSDATTSSSGLMSSSDKTKLNGIATGAEVNQNAFSNVKVGSTTVAADSKTDTLELVAGSNITLTPDSTNDKVTITATDTTYTNADLGHGYGTCSTAADVWQKVVDLTGFELVDGAMFSVKFDYDVPATAQMNVNNTGSIYIYYQGWTILDGLIKADDTVTFIYDGDHYCILAIDRTLDNMEYISEIVNYIGADPLTTTAQTLAGAINELNSGKVNTESGKGLSSNDYTTTEKNKLSGIATGAEVNQNAFSNVKVGSTTIAADSKTDTLELVAGSNITLTPDSTNDKVTIAATDTTYSDATTSAAGLMSAADKTKLDGISPGAEVNQWAFSNIKVGSSTVAADAKGDTFELVAGNNVTLTTDTTNDKITIAATDTTYSDATTSASGLMSSSDKTKLDGIESGAEVNVNADWNAISGDAQILNKPTLGSIVSFNVTEVTS